MKSTFILITLVISCCIFNKANAATVDLMAGPDVTLQSGDLTLRFVPSRAWTFDEIHYQGNLLNNPGAFSGLVLNFGGALFLGSGHHQAGAEKVLSIELTVDGKKIDQAQLLKGGEFKGKSIELIKSSNLVSANVEPASITPLKSVIKMDDGVLQCDQYLTPNADTNIDKLYAFMFSWTTQTTEWMAKTAKGDMLEGDFGKNSWELMKDVQWTSIYNPVYKTAAVTVFDQDSWNGAGVHHGYWNVKTYHKQYFQPFIKLPLQKGTTYHWGVKVFFTKAQPDQWKQTVKDLIGTTSAAKPAADASLFDIDKRFPAYAKGETPRWEKERAGIEALNPDMVLQPWTPVQATAQNVNVWNRDYQIGAWGLPQNVKIDGADFLQAPIQFTLNSNGKVLSPQAQLSKTYKGLADYSAQTANGISAQTQYEYDGFMRTNFHFEKSTTLDQLVLRIPFKPENAEYFHYIAAVQGLQSQQTNSRSGAIPAGQGVVFKSTFQPLVWLGNRDAGLCWFSESDQFWNPVNNPNAIQIVRYADRVELQIHFIDQKTAIPAGSTLSFGLMATPTKPRPADWRSWNFTTHQNLQLQKEPKPTRGNMVIFWHDAWRIMMMYPFPRDPETYKNEVTALHKNGAKRVFPYIVASTITGTDKTYLPDGPKEWTTPEWTAFAKDWELQPNRTPTNFRRVSPASGFADWQLDALKQMIVDDGVDGVYVDESYPYPDSVAAHGAGYTDSNGVRHVTYQLYAMRDYFKRMAYLFEKFAKGRPAIMAHASGVLSMPHLSFVDIFVTGEQIHAKVKDWPKDSDPSYIKMTPLDQWATQFTGKQFGFVSLFLPEFRNDALGDRYQKVISETAPTREMLALALLHDVPVWPLWSNSDEIYAANKVKSDFDIGSPETTYTPFWNSDAAMANQKNIYISTYQNKNGILAVVFNLSDQNASIEANFSHVPGAKVLLSSKAWDAETGKKYVVPNTGEINLIIPEHDFVLLRIR